MADAPLVAVEVDVNTRGIDVFVDGLKGDTGPIHDALNQWLKRYSAYAKRKFNENSRGGGSWAPLKLSTIKARTRRLQGPPKRRKAVIGRHAVSLAVNRKGALVSAGARVSILRDTGTLFKALNIDARGNITEDIKDGVRYGFGNVFHQERTLSGIGVSEATTAQIATWHQLGAGSNPVRPILLQPDRATGDAMTRDMERGIQKLIEQSEIRD